MTHRTGIALTLARIVGIVVGLFIGTWLDEQLFKGAPEWTSAIAPTLGVVVGWVVATFVVRRLAHTAQA